MNTILLLVIIVLILCFKNINVMVKKSDEHVMKVIIIFIIIGLIFMCKDDLVEGILSDNQMKKECRGVERCGTETKDEKGNTIQYYCLNKNENICSADKYDKCENSNDPMVWCINKDSMREFIISLDKNNDNQFNEVDFKVIDNDGNGNITDAEIGFEFLTQPITLKSIKLLYEKYTSGNTGLDPACEGITCSVDGPNPAPGECLDTSNMKCSGNMPDNNGICPQGFVNCSGDDSGSGGDSGGGDSGGGDSGVGINTPESSVQIINNTSQEPLHVFLLLVSPNLKRPNDNWSVIGGNNNIEYNTLIEHEFIEFDQNPLAKILGSKETWMELKIAKNKHVILKIPNFKAEQAWRISPVKYENSEPRVNGGDGNEQRPILIEAGKDMVANMSASDGVNFKLLYELTTSYTEYRGQEGKEGFKYGIATIDFNTNPCPNGVDGCISGFKSVCGDLNSADCEGTKACKTTDCTTKMFKPGTGPNSGNCFHGTCNLIGLARDYCEKVHEGQCLPINAEYLPDIVTPFYRKPYPEYNKEEHGIMPGKYPGCTPKNEYTTYCYDFDDANSQPYFVHPYKIRLTYSDL